MNGVRDLPEPGFVAKHLRPAPARHASDLSDLPAPIERAARLIDELRREHHISTADAEVLMAGIFAPEGEGRAERRYRREPAWVKSNDMIRAEAHQERNQALKLAAAQNGVEGDV